MDIIKSAFYTLCLVIDGIVYNLVGYSYSVFDTLAKLNIFSIDSYKTFVNSIYIILGVIMLFILAYSLLRAIINPEQFAKGEASFPNLIKNVLVSLVIIVLLPTVFEFAYNFQAALLNNDVIPKLILGENEDVSGDGNAGRRMAFYVFNSFFHPSEEFCEDVDVDPELDTCSSKISSGDGTPSSYVSNDVDDNNLTLKQANQRVLAGESSFSVYTQFGTAVTDGEINYTLFISTIAGAVLLWVIISFCFDMAIRVIKLLFYQVIAPIPVVCRIIPGGHLKDAFSKWTKQVISLFVEVFIRIAAMTFGVSLIDIVISSLGNINVDGLALKFVIRVLLIMGILIFIKQLPKLLGDLFGLDTGGMKLGIMDKLAAGGGLIAGAAVSGGITSAVRNFHATRAQGGSFGAAFKSGVGGLGSGTLRSGYNAKTKGAKNFKDMFGAASAGAAAAGAAKTRRAAKTARYKANGQDALTGRFTDMVDSVKDWATGGIGQFEDRIKMGNEFKSSGDAIFDEAGKILSKNSNNVDMVASMIDNNGKSKFKGDTNGDLLKLYQEYSGMSLSAIEADINRQANIVDFSALVNRTDFEKEQIDLATGKKSKVFDARGYQDAIDREARKHAAKMANLRSMYNQLEKETKMNIVNVALNSDMKIDGIDDSKLQSIRDKVDTFKEQYSQVGSTVVDPASNKSYKEISQSGDIAHQIDDIATAFANISSAASADAAKHRQAMEARKGNK